MFTRSLSKGPLISVLLSVRNLMIQKVSLRPSNEFSYTIEGDLGLQPEIHRQLLRYIEKKDPFFNLPLSLESLSPYRQKVLHAISRIPFGHTSSYARIAAESSSPSACRAVGTACRENPYPLLIPCHRVLKKNGDIGGFSGGEALKRRLLSFEGIHLYN